MEGHASALPMPAGAQIGSSSKSYHIRHHKSACFIRSSQSKKTAVSMYTTKVRETIDWKPIGSLDTGTVILYIASSRIVFFLTITFRGFWQRPASANWIVTGVYITSVWHLSSFERCANFVSLACEWGMFVQSVSFASRATFAGCYADGPEFCAASWAGGAAGCAPCVDDGGEPLWTCAWNCASCSGLARFFSRLFSCSSWEFLSISSLICSFNTSTSSRTAYIKWLFTRSWKQTSVIFKPYFLVYSNQNICLLDWFYYMYHM